MLDVQPQICIISVSLMFSNDVLESHNNSFFSQINRRSVLKFARCYIDDV